MSNPIEDFFPDFNPTDEGILRSVFTKDSVVTLETDDPAIDMQDLISFITTDELLEALNSIGKVVFTSQTPIADQLIAKTDFADIIVSSAIPGHRWDNDNATDELWVCFDYKNVNLNNAELCVQFNREFAGLQVFTDQSCRLYARTKMLLRSGVTLENLMWQFVHAFQDAERIHYQIILHA